MWYIIIVFGYPGASRNTACIWSFDCWENLNPIHIDLCRCSYIYIMYMCSVQYMEKYRLVSPITSKSTCLTDRTSNGNEQNEQKMNDVEWSNAMSGIKENQRMSEPFFPSFPAFSFTGIDEAVCYACVCAREYVWETVGSAKRWACVVARYACAICTKTKNRTVSIDWANSQIKYEVVCDWWARMRMK